MLTISDEKKLRNTALCFKGLKILETQLMHFFTYCRQGRICIFVCARECVCFYSVLIEGLTSFLQSLFFVSQQKKANQNNSHLSSVSSFPVSASSTSTHGLVTAQKVGQASPHSKHITSSVEMDPKTRCFSLEPLDFRTGRVQVCWMSILRPFPSRRRDFIWDTIQVRPGRLSFWGLWWWSFSRSGQRSPVHTSSSLGFPKVKQFPRVEGFTGWLRTLLRAATW